MIYFLVFFLLLICIYAFDYRGYTRFYSFSYWGLLAIFIFVVGMRFRIGTDSIVYERLFADMPKFWEFSKYNFNTTRFEPGFIFFTSIPRSFSSDFTLFQFFHAIVINSIIFWFILKNTSHRFVCLSFYYLILYLNLNTQVLREALAVVTFLLAWPFFRDGKWLQYYLLALLSVVFHTSAFLLLFLPLFCLPGIKKAFRFGWRTLFICVGLLLAGYIIQKRFSEFFMLLSFSERMSGRVHEYAHNAMSGSMVNIVGAINVFVTTMFFPLVALYFANNKMKGEKDKLKLKHFHRLEMMVLLCIYLSVLSIPIFILSRYYNYFGIFSFVVVASWVFSKLKYKRKYYKLNFGYWALVLAAFYLINFNTYYLTSANKAGTLKTYMVYYPYVSRLDPSMNTNREAVFKYYDAR